MEVITMSKRKDDYEEVGIQYDGAGNEIHVFDGPAGKMFIKKLKHTSNIKLLLIIFIIAECHKKL